MTAVTIRLLLSLYRCNIVACDVNAIREVKNKGLFTLEWDSQRWLHRGELCMISGRINKEEQGKRSSRRKWQKSLKDMFPYDPPCRDNIELSKGTVLCPESLHRIVGRIKAKWSQVRGIHGSGRKKMTVK